jgi:hypothetical protein
VKVNKDLVDALLMLCVISLVFAGVSEFADLTHKTVLIGMFAVAIVTLIIFRVLAGRQP